jgi:hypothetical protein
MKDPQLVIDVFGTKEWYVNGMRHRLDGPAIEDPRNNGDRWFIDYKELNQQQFDQHPLVIFHRLSKAR